MSPSPAESPAQRTHPSKLFVEVTTHCNLGCAMCVKQTKHHGMTEGVMAEETFSALAPAFPHLETLILNGIGEPLLHPQLEAFIRKAKELMPATGWVGFQSNGLLMNEDRAASLVKAGLDRICISMDAASPETFRRLREGGEVGDIERAFRALTAARTAYPSSRLEIGIEFVVMRDNIRELPEALRWAARRGATFAIVTQLIPYDEAHVSLVAYDCSTDAAVALFDEWKQIADHEGIDLGRYREVAFRFSRNLEEQRIVDFVNRMKEHALSRNIFFNLEKLLMRDDGWFTEAAGIFDEARTVAEEEGLDLQLPELVPKEKRCCEFVEGGGAFISWDGNVHPCYFLWHRYHCHVQGWNQMVQPRSFGSVTLRGINDVWNDRGFREFRESVLLYDYPHCLSCTLAPCDYVQAEEFEQDCHIRPEPCGSCLWCMGVFQCLR
ncbi:radical SAM/SPASM domain-containing protein [Geobacter pickeringii]|uniref:Radical SAM protein n=1 Tax=Geobacter pickeringii TaxID=345632 RepID=A0A0B5B969_9BACT|nr:radical SAM/SPASM domain-containing protein [Geobacter pickeringii]AJE03112.1 radical SAM protein [Geobacter pickeringii]